MTAPSTQESGKRVDIKVSGGTMAVRLLGNGPPVVLLHGISANHTEWLAVARLLSDRYRVILPDLLGRGDTIPEPGARYSVADETHRLTTVLKKLEVHDPVLAGHSHGATLALALALEIPCRRILLVSPVTPHTRRPPVLGVLRSKLLRMAILPIVRTCRRPLTRYILTRRVYGDQGPDIESAVSRYVTPYAEKTRARALLQILAEWRPGDVGLLSRPVGIPIDVATGREDRRIMADHVSAWADRLGAKLLVIPGAGHGITEERPELCARLVGEGIGIR